MAFLGEIGRSGTKKVAKLTAEEAKQAAWGVFQEQASPERLKLQCEREQREREAKQAEREAKQAEKKKRKREREAKRAEQQQQKREAAKRKRVDSGQQLLLDEMMRVGAENERYLRDNRLEHWDQLPKKRKAEQRKVVEDYYRKFGRGIPDAPGVNLCDISKWSPSGGTKWFRPQFECRVRCRDGLDGRMKTFHFSSHTSIQSASKMYEVKKREWDDMLKCWDRTTVTVTCV